VVTGMHHMESTMQRAGAVLVPFLSSRRSEISLLELHALVDVSPTKTALSQVSCYAVREDRDD
jgi:hypothetical protein